MSIKIFHNPRCSKSRQTLQLLQDRGIEPDIIEYLKNPPTADELKSLLSMLQLDARGLMRTRESEYREQGLDNPELDEESLINAMVTTPGLIERPIVINGKRAAIGRPPENVLDIL